MADATPHIVFAEPFENEAVDRLRALGRVTVLDRCDDATLMTAAGDCDALLIRSQARVTRAVLDRAGRLRVVGRGGVGLENIDLEAAKERGIVVVYTPGAATEAVADLTVGMIISLVRRLVMGDAMIREGRFAEAREQLIGIELSDLTVGIVGLGRIGKAVARCLRSGFGTRVLYNDIADPGWLDFVATPVSKERLYRESDVVSLHVPLTERTRHLIDGVALAMFKPGSMLVNTSRGAVVDAEALAGALARGHLAGAALDVLDPEPPRPDHPLVGAPNVLLSPHVGARTTRGLHRMNAVVEDVARVLRGAAPEHPAFV